MAKKKTTRKKSPKNPARSSGNSKTPVGKPTQTLTPAKVKAVIQGMHEAYPDADCELRHENALQLLVATILSAQSTDKMINQVTEFLFEKYRTAEDFANADPEEFQQEIKSSGFFRNKTKSVLGAAKKIVKDFGGEVPQTMEELLTLPGVARKTANVVLGTCFRKPAGVVVDTHVKRLSNRIGLSNETNPDKIERELMKVLPRDEWIFMGHAIIWHGRRVCGARKPLCEQCNIRKVCQKNGVE